ncbi:MFS transporter [Massilibacterium senegalense]|uniref:MFS transporter n=1 Tax=Massilibacterium senegalense TaxID=1632858 RepID=UPI000780511F|nr:MFS transporter [Massilibacterium senegalense]
MSQFSKQEKSWMLYDWANSAYSLIITTTVFPLYYKSVATNAGVSLANSTAYLGYTIAIATFILAMLGPILGAMADYEGMKKKFFLFFFTMGTVATASLAFVSNDHWIGLLMIYTITAVGFHGANIFYDAFLVDVTSKGRRNLVSSRGFGFGYIGSTIPFMISIALIITSQKEWIPLATSTATRLAFVITAIWWFVFTIPMMKHVTQVYGMKWKSRIVSSGFHRLGHTLRDIRKYRAVFLFLLAYFFYIDGVGTIISMSTAYGTDLGISATSLLLILFVTQVVAAPFAILYGKLAQKFTGKKMLYVGIFMYIIVCIYAFFMETAVDFWILAMLVATSQGGIQSLSRSYFANIIPKEKANEFFGFYNIFGKFAAIMGPLLVAFTTQLTGNSAYGVFSLVLLFMVGMMVLVFVPKPEKSCC